MPERIDLKVWQARICLARAYLDEYGNSGDRWTRNVKALSGDFNSVSELGEEAIDVNMIRSNTRSSLPPLYLEEPYISVKPRLKSYQGQDNIARARYCELEINYWFRELRLRQEIKKIIHDAECTNIGYLYMGWSKPKDVKQDGDPLQYRAEVKAGRPFLLRHPPRDVLVPPGYPDLDCAPWVSIVFRKPRYLVERQFGAEVTADIPTLGYQDSYQRITSKQDPYYDTAECQLVEIHNVWDKDSGLVYILVEKHDRYLEEPKAWPVKVEGFPLERMQPELIPDEFFGTPPISFSLPQNKELNAVRTSMRGRFSRSKSTIWTENMPPEAVEQYKRGQDGEVISLQSSESERPIRDRILIDGGLPADPHSLTYEAVIKQDLREQSIGSERRGAGDPNVKSATASANIEKGTQIREADRADQVRGLYLGASRKLWQMLLGHPNEERTRLIAGPMAGMFSEVRYKLSDIEGEFAFEMELSAAIATTPQQRMARATLNYNLLRQDPRVDPDRLIIDVLDAQNTIDPESYLLRLRDPVEEHAMMEQGLPVEASGRDDHLTHIQAHDQTEDQWDELLQRLPDNLMRKRLALAQTLLIAHGQNHLKLLAEATGRGQGQAGSSVNQNLLRQGMAVERGEETAAEMGGEPLVQ